MAPRLEAITGSMYGGKSEEVVRRLATAAYAGKRILLLKPKVDDRNERNIFNLVKRNKKLARYGHIAQHAVKSLGEVKNLMKDFGPDILAFDEVQFFNKSLPKMIDRILAANCDSDLLVIVSGLDMDAWRKPFANMAQLLAMADCVNKMPAVCVKCKDKRGPAVLTQKKPKPSNKKSRKKKRVEVGGVGLYEARCRACHTIPI